MTLYDERYLAFAFVLGFLTCTVIVLGVLAVRSAMKR